MERIFKLDRSAFKAINAKEADNHMQYWRDKTYAERLAAAMYLIYKAYGVPATVRMDKTVFAKRKR